MAAPHAASSVTITHRAVPGAPSSPAAGSSKIGPNRGLPPPPLACAASAGASTTGTNVSSAWGSEVTSAVRATSRRCGGVTTASSDPPEKITCPVHHENVSLARYAPTGPRFSGGGNAPRAIPPDTVVDDRRSPAGGWRDNAPVTIRVAAIGESALTVTPGGAARPICHVSAATARFAQLYAPASAARHPEPDVTPTIRPCPAASMIGSALRRTLRYPSRWTLSTPAQSSSVPEANPVGRLMPATLTTASSAPNSSTRSANSARTEASSVTDVADARAVPPAATIRSAVVSSGDSIRLDPSSETTGSMVTTNAPVRPTASAIAAPIPAAPPVTTTTRCPLPPLRADKPAPLDLRGGSTASRTARRAPVRRSCPRRATR